jgi:hypothetical protein
MTDPLRRALLDDSDAPAGLSPNLRFMGARQGALAAVLLDHSVHFRGLHERFQRDGSSLELRAEALVIANNLGVLLQELRRREDLVQALTASTEFAGPPLFVIDTLYFMVMLLAGELSEYEATQILVSPDAMDSILYETNEVRDWLLSFGVNPDTR